MAYATQSGSRDLISRFKKRIGNWSNLQKKWLVSIDFGRTEAKALEILQSLPNFEVRIPSANELLDNALIPQRCFHPKTFVFDTGSEVPKVPRGIFHRFGEL